MNFTTPTGIIGENISYYEVWAPTFVNHTTQYSASDDEVDVDDGIVNITAYYNRNDTGSTTKTEQSIDPYFVHTIFVLPVSQISDSYLFRPRFRL